ncbi:MAG: Beta-lactamase, partial [Steroidobacteraceae bacterium]|nr:Beta-lactamase [Steroidobacteraceae bacterium]
ELQGSTDARAQDDAVDAIRRAYAGQLLPDALVDVFRHPARGFPSRRVARGRAVRELPPGAPLRDDLCIHSNGSAYDIVDYVSRNRVAGLLVLHEGRVALEQYQFGNTAATRWLSMSVAKSVSTTLVGAAVQDGCIGSIDDLVSSYVPELIGSSYDGVSIRHLMQMSSGVRWDDTHTDERSERRHMLELQFQQHPGSILRYVARQPRAAPPGTVWNYSTGETHIVGALLREAVGRPVSEYLSERIWARAGMESDATWWLESPDGLEVAGSGLGATLRDYGRFALFLLEDGVVDGTAVLPAGWMAQARGPCVIGGKSVDYGFMWWPVAARDGTYEAGAYSARGIFGQYIYVNPARQLAIVVWSARAKPKGAEVIADNDFFNAVAEAF